MRELIPRGFTRDGMAGKGKESDAEYSVTEPSYFLLDLRAPSDPLLSWPRCENAGG